MRQSNILLCGVRVARIMRIWTDLESREQRKKECFLKDKEDVWQLEDDKDLKNLSCSSLGCIY